MKKKVTIIGTLVSIIGVSVGVLLSNTSINSFASKSNVISKNTENSVLEQYYKNDTSHSTGLIDSNVEQKLNMNGLSDELIQSLNKDELSIYKEIKDLNSLQITTNYYSLNEESGIITKLNQKETISTLNKINSNQSKSTLSIRNNSDIATGKEDYKYSDGNTFKVTIVLNKTGTANKNKINLYSLQVYYEWLEMPKNRGYDIIGFKFTPGINLQTDFTISEKSVYCGVYWDEFNNSTKNCHVKVNQNKNNVQAQNGIEINYDGGTGHFSSHTNKMPRNIPADDSKLSKKNRQKLKEAGANWALISTHAYVINATLSVPKSTEQFFVCSKYGHQINNTDWNFKISGISWPPSISFEGEKKYESYYKNLPQKDLILNLYNN